MLAIGAGVGATLLAGCAGAASPISGSEKEMGEFRLLISDQPADIGDFERLDVSFSDARVFPAGAEETTTQTTTQNQTATTTQNQTTTTSQTETTTAPETTDGEAEEEPEEAENAEDGYSTIDLEGKTVDLTQVIGEDATPVFEGELEAGEYAKVELNVAAVTGIVDGEEVEVKVPSEKLMITNNFEVSPDEQTEFVFDIHVVKRGPTNGYILRPVISESGVAGRDVEYQEVPQNGTTTEA